MIVMKFGGTSLESAEAIERAGEIVRARLERKPLVVVSAIGKTTSRILAAADKAAAGDVDEALYDVDQLESFHRVEGGKVIAPALHPRMKAVLAREFESLETAMEQIAEARQVTPVLWDATASHGERLSSALVALAFESMGMDAVHLDARTVIVTDSNHTQALPWNGRTNAQMKEVAAPLVASHQVVVMGGFIGSSMSGVTTTLGRGGSDFSAAIAGAGLGAEEIQIWTDVDGMLTCDPRVLPGGRRLKKVSFDEAAEMAYFGAKVLHPAMMLPAVEKNIPVRILNSQRPEVEGTLIVGETVRSTNPVKSIACKRGVTVVNVRSLRMLMAHGFLNRIFDVFDRYRTPVDMVATSEVSVSLTIDQTQMLSQIEAELSKIAEVTVTPGQAILCLVGDAIRDTPGVSARVFGALARAGVNTRMISQGASLLNLSIAVEDAEVVKAAAVLHEELFSSVDEAVFA